LRFNKTAPLCGFSPVTSTKRASKQTITAFSDFFQANQHQLIVWAIGATPPSEKSQHNLQQTIPLQLNQLKNLTTQSNGRLVIMSHDKQDIEQVNRYIEHNLVIVDNDAHPWHDASYPLVFIIALLFLFWFRKGWTLQW